MKTNRRTTLALAAALITTVCTSAWSQTADWPTKPVRLLVPAAAGTAPDIMARVLGERLSKIWQQPVVVDNRPGAGGVIGMTAVKNADRDSHGFVFAPASIFTLTPYMYKTSQVDIVRDFTAVAMVGLSPMMAAVSATSPANSLADLIRMAQRDPNKFVVATTFQYSFPHLAAEMLSKAAGVPLRAVPFTNSTQSMSAVVNGDAQMVIDGVPPLDPMIKGNRLKAVAMFSEERLPKRAQLATVAETYPSMVVNGWFGVLAPTGTSARAIERVNRDLATVLSQADVIERLDGLGVYPKVMTQPQFADFWIKERTRWEQVLRDVGAQPLVQ
ncbi:MAG: tripartite tricarboxylate transporter substrate binding protein [Pseudomonadota bacterium]